MDKLAILGGEPAVGEVPADLFRWPIVTQEDEEAVLHVLRNSLQSDVQITQQFEREFAEWLDMQYAVAYCNGTLSLGAAMFGWGIGTGAGIFCPS